MRQAPRLLGFGVGIASASSPLSGNTSTVPHAAIASAEGVSATFSGAVLAACSSTKGTAVTVVSAAGSVVGLRLFSSCHEVKELLGSTDDRINLNRLSRQPSSNIPCAVAVDPYSLREDCGFLLVAKITGVTALLYTWFVPASRASGVELKYFSSFRCLSRPAKLCLELLRDAVRASRVCSCARVSPELYRAGERRIFLLPLGAGEARG